MSWLKISPRLAWLLFYIAIALILGANSFGYLDPDFGWHLRVGENIALEKSVPHDQVYLWSLANQNWVDHEWLSDLLTYGLWQSGGYIAINLFFILIPLITLIVLNRYLFTHYITEKSQQSFFAVIELLAFFACLPHFGVRMQEFAFLFTALLFIIIDSYRRQPRLKIIYFLPILIFLWACLHGSFLFSIVIISGWLVYEIILKLWPKFRSYFNEKDFTNKNLIILAVIILLSIGSTLVTPYGTELYAFLSEYGKNRYYLSNIVEWRTPYSVPFAYLQIFYTQIIFILAILSHSYSNKKLPLWKTFLATGLLLMASRSVRHFPLWAIGSLLFLAPTIIKHHLISTKTLYSSIITKVALICFVLIAISLNLGTEFNNQPFVSYCQRYPCGAVQFLKDNPQYAELKMFNDYGWGGFLIGVWPEQKLFIDGRLPQYTFKHHTMLEEYSEFFHDQKTQAKLNEHDIKLVLFKTKEAPSELDWFEELVTGDKSGEERKNPLIEYLKNSSDWQSVYSDKVATIYIKK